MSVAITYDNGIVMASVRKAESSLVMDVGTRKIARVSDGVAVSYAGLAADSRCACSETLTLPLGRVG